MFPVGFYKRMYKNTQICFKSINYVLNTHSCLGVLLLVNSWTRKVPSKSAAAHDVNNKRNSDALLQRIYQPGQG